MKTRFGIWALFLLLMVGDVYAQEKQPLGPPFTVAAAQHRGQQLEKAFAAFRAGALHEGLVLMQAVYHMNQEDEDVIRLYRLNANRFAIRIAEDCDAEPGFSNCDTAIKYVELAKRLGDGSVYHEVRAMALYNKALSLEEEDFATYRYLMPTRSLSKDIGYRYIPEERKAFFKQLLNEALSEIQVARGDLDRHEKVEELTAKIRVIERSQKAIGSR